MKGFATATALIAVLGAMVVPVTAVAQVPRGARPARVQPTHVVAREVECRAGATVFTLRPGALLRASGRPGARAVSVEVVGPVSATCRVDPAALGLRLARDVPVRRGSRVVGTVHEGALVRLVPRARVSRGQVAVEVEGDTRARFTVPRDALTVESGEFLYRQPLANRWVTPKSDLPLFERKESVNTNAEPVGTIAGGVEVVLLEQDGLMARVRSYGEIEIEGWSTNNSFLDQRTPVVEPQLLAPTHEVLAGAALIDANGRRVADLAGGTLVEVTGGDSSRARITTTGRVVVTGTVARADLRELADAQVLPTP